MSKRGTSKAIRFGTNTNSMTHVVSPKNGRIIQQPLNPPVVRTPSVRNTHWNGAVQLPSNQPNYGGAYKWRGHVPSPTDTVTNAGLGDYDIMGRGFQEVQDLLDRAGTAFTQMAQDVIAKGAVEGRKKATLLEEQKFRLGKVWTHTPYPSLGASGPGSMWKSSSRFDPRLGGYRGVSSSGNALRLINFNFKAGHTYGSLGDLPGTIEARVTSQLANLFENDARWRKKSPYWVTEGSGWGVFRPGSTRQGRHYFNQFYRLFDEGLLDGIKEAENTFNARVNKASAKQARWIKKAQAKII